MGVTTPYLFLSMVDMMARLTPGLGIKGPFLLRPPFTTQPDVEYTATSLRSFAEIRARADISGGADPLKLIYTPVGLDAGAMQADIDEGAYIVVLSTKQGELIYVPDTYIESYPHMGSIPYSYLTVSYALGMFADTVDVELIKQVGASAISDYIGVEPTAFISRGEVSDVITEERHIQLTISRQQAVKNRETDRAKALRLTDELLKAKQLNAEYELLIQELSKPPAAAD